MRTMKKVVMVICALAALAGTAGAAVIASESFTYATASTLAGNGAAGGGWAGAWGGGAFPNDMTITDYGLSYNTGGVVIDGGNRAVLVTDSANSGTSKETRSFSANPADTALYIRFLMNMQSGGWSNADTMQFQVTGLRSASSRKDVSDIGIDVNNTPNPDEEFSADIASVKSNEVNYDLTPDQTYLVVVKYWADPSAPVFPSKYNTMDVYINPNLAGTTGYIGTAQATVDPYLSPGQVDGINLLQMNAESTDFVTFDEYAMGQSWGDVVVPEPATMALLAFGGLTLLRRKK